MGDTGPQPQVVDNPSAGNARVTKFMKLVDGPGADWESWDFLLQVTLEEANAARWLSNELAANASAESKAAAKLAFLTIVMNVDLGLMPLVRTTRSACQAYNRLKTRFSPQRSNDLRRVLGDFWTSRMEDWDDCMSYATKLAEWRELANNITAGSIPESAISTQFLKGLPARYEAVVTAIDVRGETDMDTILPLVRDFETKIGVTGGTQAQAPALHAGTSSAELCRQFARGQCRRGDRCRYRHASAPSQSNGRSHAGRREGRTCHYCGKEGI